MFRAKRFRALVYVCLLWSIVSGFLIYNDLYSTSVVDQIIIAVVGFFITIATPFRSRTINATLIRPAIVFKGSQVRKRSCPTCFMVAGHFFGLIALMLREAVIEKGHDWWLPLFAYFIGFGFSYPLLFWRPLILRLLFGFEKRTRFARVLGWGRAK